MAKQNRAPARGTRRSNSGGGAGKLLLGIVLGVGLTLAGIAAYMRFGNPPVGVTDASSLWEPLVASVPLNARAHSEAKSAPFAADEDVFEGAAHTYRAQCANCHGTPGRDAALGRSMVPHAPQFFEPRDARITAAQTPGELYWKTAHGARRSGMPAYAKALTDTQLWQLALLLHSTRDELPDPVRRILTDGVPPPQPTVVKP
ncbi:c-type cytochrome [Terriglobus roseus]|uniref:Cytochrome C oxidase, cbb3-type, subunit III n=1 Tax=Terriglobus roseus TaxID=392734 RepID=A0A1H4JJH2_9BACT|nr:cytochrome c [Terriglobus roseus]SEB45818.1 Cytochrome C oxidase, cbb3-type, subunit III [Terriglobus roseus]